MALTFEPLATETFGRLDEPSVWMQLLTTCWYCSGVGQTWRKPVHRKCVATKLSAGVTGMLFQGLPELRARVSVSGFLPGLARPIAGLS
jgi:hypothetical protein